MSPEPSPNPNGGPNTPEGRAISSQNAITYGLYAACDFVRPNEESTYRALGERLFDALAPVGLLENNLVNEIHRAMWRLSRCGEVEHSFVTDQTESDTTIADPMRNETQAKTQLSVDRARALYQRLLHKCTAELRKLQAERQLRNESFKAGFDLSQFGLCDWAFISKSVDRQTISGYRAHSMEIKARVDSCYAPPVRRDAQPGSFCQTARNAQCPCGSGQKHKRCCGRNAPPLQKAA